MPGSLFYHHYLISLNKAVEKLKSQCQESNNSKEQKEFNINSQIPLMNTVLQEIKQIDINIEEPNWINFRNLMHDVIDTAKVNSLKSKNTKQKDTGTTISTTLMTEFSNKLLAMFDELRKDTQAHFLNHCDKDKALYISSDYSASPFINQLINITIGYRAEKITEKHLTGINFSSKHQNKFAELTQTIILWEKHQKNKDLTFKEYKNTIKGILNNLIEAENKIQCEVGNGAVGYLRGVGLWAVSKYNEGSDSLRVSLPLLKKSFIRDCRHLPASALAQEEEIIVQAPIVL